MVIAAMVLAAVGAGVLGWATVRLWPSAKGAALVLILTPLVVAAGALTTKRRPRTSIAH